MPTILKVKIGLEHERVIFSRRTGKPANVRGKPQSQFPHDTLSCLAETRGYPSFDAGEAVVNFLSKQAYVDGLYRSAGYDLPHGEFTLTPRMAKAAYEVEAGKEKEEQKFNLVRGGGLHLHFSLMPEDDSGIYRTSLLLCDHYFICLAVRLLDLILEPWIEGKSSYRKPGQSRVKPHGFEYRSPLWTGDVTSLLKIATDGLRAVTDTVTNVHNMVESIRKVNRTGLPAWVDPSSLEGATLRR